MKNDIPDLEKTYKEINGELGRNNISKDVMGVSDVVSFQNYCSQLIEANNYDEIQTSIQQFLESSHDAFRLDYSFLEDIYKLSINFENLNCAITALNFLRLVFRYDADSKNKYQNPEAFADLRVFFRKEGESVFHQDEVDYFIALIQVHHTMIDFLDHLNVINTIFLYNQYKPEPATIIFFSQLAKITIMQSKYSQNQENILNFIFLKTMEILENVTDPESCQTLIQIFLNINRLSKNVKIINIDAFRICQCLFDEFEENYKVDFIHSINLIDYDFFPLGYSWIYQRFIGASDNLKAAFISYLSNRINVTDVFELIQDELLKQEFTQFITDVNPRHISSILHFINRFINIISKYPKDEFSDFVYSYDVINFLTEIRDSVLSSEDFYILVSTAYSACKHFIKNSNIEALQKILNEDFIESLEEYEYQKMGDAEQIIENLRQLYDAASKFE